MDTAQILREWFAAHARGDLTTARALLDDDAVMRVPGMTLHGFDEFMDWYADRRRSEPEFSYEVVDVLAGETHAAAVIRLRTSAATWRQVALYEIGDNHITSMTAYEDEPAP